MPLRFEILRPASLAAVHWQRWSEIQAAEPALESPYFRPEFTQAVAQVRRDVEVAVMLQGNEAVGFLPFQRGPLNIGKPVGGKLSDYHGVIARSGAQIDTAELLRACRLAGWDFDHLVTTQPSFEPFATGRGESPYLDLSQGYEQERPEGAGGALEAAALSAGGSHPPPEDRRRGRPPPI